ncbi:hypothetical protein I6A84_26765 [Frankia sp. CNm7]|uniref:hypothetical protein n=1 Tax=Frankia nepalensis TaxID=1836974 RepID=UPI0019339952|nr:hypothetical protein [Frankia nepalensis]MBL7521584.1 hypothetical protein [Frankia nepalensis]
MRPFDANDYRSRVLGPIHARGGVEYSDPFEVYDIPLDEAATLADTAVAAQIDAVWAFWQRSRDHPRYRGVILGLLTHHDELSEALRTRASRTELAERVRLARSEREGERFKTLDAAAARLVERFGGLPEDKIAGLRAIAAAAGVSDAEFEARIAHHKRLGAGAPASTGRRQVPAEVFRQVRADLEELGRIVGEDAPRSLFELLGISPGADRETIRAVREETAARNRARRPDRRRALIDDLLAAVTTLLVDGDPEAYLDALAAAAAQVLRPRLKAALLVEDRLTPDDARTLVKLARDEGLDPARATALVRSLAREEGLDEAAGAAARGGAAEPRTQPRPAAPVTSTPTPAPTPRTEPRPLPAPTPRVEPRPPARPGPGTTGARPGHPGWQEVLAQARAALEAGTPIAASDGRALAQELAGGALPPIRQLGEEIEAAVRRSIEWWAQLVRAVADGRLEQASRLAESLARTGRDVPGPEGAELAEVTARIEERLRQAAELVASAPAGGPSERAAVALAALELVTDSVAARALLAESLAPPSALAVTRGSGAVEVRWAPSPTPGVRYRVTRIGADGSARTVGSTEATYIEDGGVRAGADLPGYEVRAGVGDIWSRPAVWPQVVEPEPEPPAVPVAEPAADPAERPAAGALAEPPVSPATATDPDAGADDDERTRLLTRTPADALEPARDLAVVAGRLRWVWPDGCTEVFVVWRPDAPPIAANDPAAQSRKVTNTRYELDDGFALPAARPLHVAVFGCLRDPAGRLVVASLAAAPARRYLPARDRL